MLTTQCSGEIIRNNFISISSRTRRFFFIVKMHISYGFKCGLEKIKCCYGGNSRNIYLYNMLRILKI